MVESPKPLDHESRAHSLSIDNLPQDIFKGETKALLPASDATPADNLKALVQECGVAPHKISELLHELPPRNMTDKLVDLYFTGVSVQFAARLLRISHRFAGTGPDILSRRRISAAGTTRYTTKVPLLTPMSSGFSLSCSSSWRSPSDWRQNTSLVIVEPED